MRWAAQKDGNHKAIVKGLRDANCSVVELEGRRPGLPDLLVGYASRNHLIEIKMPGNDLTDAQEGWHKQWKGDTPWVCETLQECLLAVGVDPPF